MPFQLRASNNVGWASCPDTHRSTNNDQLLKSSVFHSDSLVSWKSKKKTIVLNSLAEAKYRALTAIVIEVLWIIQLLKDLHIITVRRPLWYFVIVLLPFILPLI